MDSYDQAYGRFTGHDIGAPHKTSTEPKESKFVRNSLWIGVASFFAWTIGGLISSWLQKMMNVESMWDVPAAEALVGGGGFISIAGFPTVILILCIRKAVLGYRVRKSDGNASAAGFAMVWSLLGIVLAFVMVPITLLLVFIVLGQLNPMLFYMG